MKKCNRIKYQEKCGSKSRGNSADKIVSVWHLLEEELQIVLIRLEEEGNLIEVVCAYRRGLAKPVRMAIDTASLVSTEEVCLLHAHLLCAALALPRSLHGMLVSRS